MTGAREQAAKWLAEAEQAPTPDARAAAAQVAQVYALLGVSDRMDMVIEQLAIRPRPVVGAGGWPKSAPERVVMPGSVARPDFGRGAALEEQPNPLEDQEQH